ncbi:MAG: hypothetical protein ACK5KQ_00165 [Anaerorhabdus sp.]
MYKIYWTDMHSNIHHEDIDKLPLWINQARELFDFWPIAYYPYTMRLDETGLMVEDKYPDVDIQEDWEYVKKQVEQENSNGFSMFLGYEWQGAGEDGDHNVFFKENDGKMIFPLRYQSLKEKLTNYDVIAIPHHLAYQLGHRGKNWSTHDDKFSPFVEIYSSHGSSENDFSNLPMLRHVHMGPRTDVTSVEMGLQNGNKFGVIASGDNHSCPGVFGFGLCAVLAKSSSKEDIWDALINKRVYGVSKERINIDFSIDDTIMGSEVVGQKNSRLKLDVVASNTIDRVEIIKDNKVIDMISHIQDDCNLSGKVKFKFQLELGWGPDRRIFPDIESRNWSGKLITDGEIKSIEKCWSNFGQTLNQKSKHECEFNLTTFKTTASGKWMGPSAITTEGFIFEIEDDINNSIMLEIDGIEYQIKIRDILSGSKIIPLLDEVKELIKDRFNFTEYYRSDPWWHNCYKIKINKGATENEYKKNIDMVIDTSACSNVRIKTYQKNGSVAWSSPVFIKK